MGKERGQRWGWGVGVERDQGNEKMKFHLLLTKGNFQIWLQVIKSSESPQAFPHRNNSLTCVRVYAKRLRNCAWPSGANLPSSRWLP